MSDKYWALLGNWSFIQEQEKGMTIYEYDAENGMLTEKETILPDLYAGMQYFDPNRDIDYVVNEIAHRRGESGGGGYVVALKLDRRTGSLTLVNEKESLAPEPSYLYGDKSGKYLFVVHHIDSGHVTKISKVDGKYQSETFFDDAAAVLFEIKEDGSLGDACDVQIVKGLDPVGIHAIPHLHSVVADPSGELYTVCDKGLDRIYTYRIDRENGKLVPVSVTVTPDGTSPRYLTYHPTLPLVYVNFEKCTDLYVYRYDTENGIGDLVTTLQLLEDEKSAEGVQRVEASDILVTDDAKHLYVCIRGVNLIAVMDLDEDGLPTLVQNVGCQGDPRGITLAPDGRYMFSCNMMAGTISTFQVREDGTLQFRDNNVKGVNPANILFVKAE
ncbi:MAG: lactonase family protein [Lachnospiraceae bacterium]|nr:lactonase family protein [Lachnospiraceae bacterium]